MAIIDKFKVGSTTYDVSPSASGTLNTTGTTKFASSDTAQASATSWTNVDQMTTSDNHATLFTKITQMAKNVRYLYNVLGTGFSTGSTVKSQIDSKAPSSHSHSVGQLPTSSTQVNSNDYIPTSALIYSMNQTLTSLNDACLKKSGGTMTGTINFGSGSYYINTSGVANFSKCYGAVYNDYAEFFPRGEDTEPGDIIALDENNKEEKYIKATNKSSIIAGVHSDEYAMLIGGEAVSIGEDYISKNIKKYIPVSLCGRVYVKVIGNVDIGDYIIPSDIPGVGVSSKEYSKSSVGIAISKNNCNKVKILVGGKS